MPGWAIALFVLTLLVPVALTTIDALARARRRGHLIGRSLALVLGTAVPFLLALAVVDAARLLGRDLGRAARSARRRRRSR